MSVYGPVRSVAKLGISDYLEVKLLQKKCTTTRHIIPTILILLLPPFPSYVNSTSSYQLVDPAQQKLEQSQDLYRVLFLLGLDVKYLLATLQI